MSLIALLEETDFLTLASFSSTKNRALKNVKVYYRLEFTKKGIKGVRAALHLLDPTILDYPEMEHTTVGGTDLHAGGVRIKAEAESSVQIVPALYRQWDVHHP